MCVKVQKHYLCTRKGASGRVRKGIKKMPSESVCGGGGGSERERGIVQEKERGADWIWVEHAGNSFSASWLLLLLHQIQDQGKIYKYRAAARLEGWAEVEGGRGDGELNLCGGGGGSSRGKACGGSGGCLVGGSCRGGVTRRVGVKGGGAGPRGG